MKMFGNPTLSPVLTLSHCMGVTKAYIFACSPGPRKSAGMRAYAKLVIVKTVRIIICGQSTRRICARSVE